MGNSPSIVLFAVILGLWGCQGAARDGIKVPGTTPWTDSDLKNNSGHYVANVSVR